MNHRVSIIIYVHNAARWLNYPNIRKLADPRASRSGWKHILQTS